MPVEMPEQSKVDAVWQRVRGSRGKSFAVLAQREQEIMGLSRRLYDLGAHRPLMKKLYTQAKERRMLLLKMASLAGEGGCVPPAEHSKAELGELVRLLGQGATEYDPEHPIYGGLFAQFRQDCVRGQRMLLAAQ